MSIFQKVQRSLASRGLRATPPVIGVMAVLSGLVLQARDTSSASPPLGRAATASGLEFYPTSLTIEQECQEDSPDGLSGTTVVGASSGAPIAVRPFLLESRLAAGIGQTLKFDWAGIKDAQNAPRVTLQQFPLTAAVAVDLSLEPFSVFDDRSEFISVTDAGESRVSPPDVLLLRGQVAGNPASHVFLGLSPHGVNGYIRYDTLTYIVSTGPAGGPLAAANRCTIAPLGADFSPTPDDLFCEMFPEGIPEETFAASAFSDSLPPLWRRCLLLVECDYDFYRRLGSNLEAALGYASILVGAASEIYERDVAISLWLNVLRVWTSVEDPYVTCGLYGLEEFRNYGNTHFQDKVWNIAHRMSGCGGGGSGYPGALCTPGTEHVKNSYSISTIQGFFPYPALSDTNSWDLFLVCHELGHNFGSPHTHCYVPPLDRCRGDVGTCYQGVDVCERGTIMSYCFRCNGISNVDLRFHPRVAELISANVRGSCLPVVGDGIRISNPTGGMMRVDSVRAPAAWLSAGSASFLIASGASRILGVAVDWSKLQSGSAVDTVFVFSSAPGSAAINKIPVMAERRRPDPAFAATADSGCWPLTVAFSDASTLEPIAWHWDFGDASSSDLQNPVHTYELPGTYNLTFTATNACGAQDAYRPFTVQVTKAGLCCQLPSLLIERFDTAAQAYDLWSCAHDAIGMENENTYEITYVADDSCGISIKDNRFISVAPLGGWYGRTVMRYRATDPTGCICENQISVVVNDPPRIHLLTPAAGVDTINTDYDIRWTDSDRDENARIALYFTEADACSGGVRIDAGDVFENQGGSDGMFLWDIRNLADGYYRLYARITDVFTTGLNCAEGIILVDRTAPVTSASMTCTQQDAGGWCNGDVLVEITATDTLTGVAATYYSLNGARDQLYTGPFTVGLEGLTSLVIHSVDRAGNEEPKRQANQPVRVDTSPPIISGMQADNNLFVSGDFTSSVPAFSIQLTDAGAGVAPARSAVAITPGTWDGPVVFTPDSSGYGYDPVTRRISVVVRHPLQPGRQKLDVLITDLLDNHATASVEFLVGTSLEMLDVVNSPNPFVRETWFTFHLTEAADVTIRIYDLSGELIRTLAGVEGQVGYNEVHWDGVSQSGLSLANGAYFYEIVARSATGTVRHLDKLAVLR